MRKNAVRLLYMLCAAAILISVLSLECFWPVRADEPVGKMSSVYGYILNDYIETYGVMSTNSPDGATVSSKGTAAPEGVIYADILNFDGNGCPYLAIFAAEEQYQTVSCHLWLYNEETEKAQRIAIIEKSYRDMTDGTTGEIGIGWNDDKRFITYTEYADNSPVKKEVYTVIEGEAYMYINNPDDIKESGVANFNACYFASGVDISDYNRNLDIFFTKLKDTAADSVTYKDISSKLGEADKTAVNRVLLRAALYRDFDIASFNTQEEYSEALECTTSTDKFQRLTAFYDLGNDIYYAKFETDRTKYNYAVLRRSDEAKNGYQLLKVRTDCIPLSDRELKLAEYEYSQNPMVMEAPQSTLEVVRPKETADITVRVGENDPVVLESEKEQKQTEKPIKIKKIFGNGIKIPAVCAGGGLSLALFTALWVCMLSDEK